jgi:hypothetical protein
MFTDVSEILIIPSSGSKSKPSDVCFLAYSSTQKMYAVGSSETSVNFCRTTGHHIPEGIKPTTYIFMLEEKKLFL